jgi:hypothetical protein
MDRLSKLCQNVERECDQPLPKKIKIEVKTEPESEPDFSLPPPLPSFVKQELGTGEVRIPLNSSGSFFIHNPPALGLAFPTDHLPPSLFAPIEPPTTTQFDPLRVKIPKTKYFTPPSSPTYPPSPTPSDVSDLNRTDVIAEFMTRIVEMKEELKELERRKTGAADKIRVGKVLTHSTKWLDEFDEYYNGRMIEYFEDAIELLEGRTEPKCDKNMFYLDCTCDIKYDEDGVFSVDRAGSCKPCIARVRDGVLARKGKRFGKDGKEKKGPITRSEVTGPSLCTCTHCLAGNWEVYDDLVHSEALYQGYCVDCGCDMEPLISNKCDVCLIKFAARVESGMEFDK